MMSSKTSVGNVLQNSHPETKLLRVKKKKQCMEWMDWIGMQVAVNNMQSLLSVVSGVVLAKLLHKDHLNMSLLDRSFIGNWQVDFKQTHENQG